jgi:NADP-dependent 3-hydroxy acid dehydrogenase YdfG
VKVAWVTGASSGIGAAVVRRLHADGYHVMGIARRADRLQALANELQPAPWVEVCDVTDETAVRRAFTRLVARWGVPDVVVSSAGAGHGASLLEGTVSDWRTILEVNVLALALCSRLAAEAMLEHGQAGTIVHISSMSGHRVPAHAGMYAASKFAVQALTEGLRLELRERGSTIRVASISPGTVQTRFGLDPDEPDRERDYPLLQAEDVADAVMYVVNAPPHVDVGDVKLRPTGQSS